MVTVLGIAIWFALHSMLLGKIENQTARNSLLESEIVELDKQIEDIKKLREQTAQLLARKKVVESLQANRAEAVHLLDELVRQLPDGVYLSAVKQAGQKVAITGFAQSNARVATLMRNLESSPWLEQAALVEVRTALQLNVDITRATTEQADKPAAKSAPAKTGFVAPSRPFGSVSSADHAAPSHGG
jgi:type IV pilus assembly protein PilN